MTNLDRAKNVRNAVRGYLGSSPSGLTSIPEIENDTATGAVRKLQVQVFALTDALVDTVAVLEETIKRVEELERRRR